MLSSQVPTSFARVLSATVQRTAPSNVVDANIVHPVKPAHVTRKGNLTPRRKVAKGKHSTSVSESVREDA